MYKYIVKIWGFVDVSYVFWRTRNVKNLEFLMLFGVIMKQLNFQFCIVVLTINDTKKLWGKPKGNSGLLCCRNLCWAPHLMLRFKSSFICFCAIVWRKRFVLVVLYLLVVAQRMYIIVSCRRWMALICNFSSEEIILIICSLVNTFSLFYFIGSYLFFGSLIISINNVILMLFLWSFCEMQSLCSSNFPRYQRQLLNS